MIFFQACRNLRLYSTGDTTGPPVLSRILSCVGSGCSDTLKRGFVTCDTTEPPACATLLPAALILVPPAVCRIRSLACSGRSVATKLGEVACLMRHEMSGSA